MRFVHRRERRRDLEREASPSDSAFPIASKNSGVASGNGFPASGPSASRVNRCCAQHGGLRQQHDIAADQIHLFVRRVVGGWRPGDRPVCRRIDVAAWGMRRCERRTLSLESRRRGTARPSRARPLPMQTRRSRTRDGPAPRASSATSTALSRPPEKQHGRRLVSASGSNLYRCCIHGTNAMYSVTKRIDFCYGHRLLDYDGICKHPHGHNAVAEIEIRTGSLDDRNMVCDFSDIKRVVKGWIDQRARSQDDPAPRRSAGGAAQTTRRAGLPRRQ